MTVALGCGNTKLTKPLIVIEGFDPPQLSYFDQLHYENFRQSLNQSLTGLNNISVILGNDLERQGYDLVYIDFDNGADYIERSAYLVEEIIQWVNQQKLNNGSVEPNVVFGQSNGGLIGRYALREMEMLGIPHDTRQFISYDSPHQGANVPLGYQYMIAELASTVIFGYHLNLWIPELQLGVDLLNNPASLEMLVYHAAAYPLPTTQRISLMSWFNQNGYPTQCELVGISNGSHTGIGEPFAPGAPLLDVETGSLIMLPPILGIWLALHGIGFHAEFHVNAVPDVNDGMQRIYKGKMYAFVHYIPVYFMNAQIDVSGTRPYDSAPGGVYDLEVFGIDLSPLNNYANVTLHSSSFCFIPTVSALDVAAPFNQDLYVNVQNLGIIANNRTPFESYWASIAYNPLSNQYNEIHIDFTPGNIEYVSSLFVGSNSLPLVGGFPNLIGVYYNYGENASQSTTDHVTNGYTIGSGSTIAINANQNLGLITDNLAPPTPGSRFDVYFGNFGCFGPPTTIEIATNGTMVLGDISGNAGVAHFTKDSKLIIRSGGKLIVNDNSRMIIEEGARIIYEDGAQIQLLGDNAVLDIQGTLELGTNAIFTFSHPNVNSGYARFSRTTYVPWDPNDLNYQIIAGAGSSMEFIGDNRDDKVLEIAQSSLWIPGALDHFTIDHGMVDFAGNAQIGSPWLSIGCPTVSLTFARFERAPLTSGGNGVMLYGQPNHTISSCIFEGLYAGLTALNQFNIGILNISTTRFTQCGTGLQVMDKGVNMSGCWFDNCYIGAALDGLTFNSTIKNCKFNNNAFIGLDVKGSPIEVVLTNCEARNNGTVGINAAGVTVNLACCDLRNNGVYGMSIDIDASLRMSPVFNGGSNDIGNNNVPVVLNEANQIEISGGRNMLKPQGPSCTGNSSVQSCPDVFVGTIQVPTCTPYVIDAKNNEWKTGTNNFCDPYLNICDLSASANNVTAVNCGPNPPTVRFSDPNQMQYQRCTTVHGPPNGGGGPPNSYAMTPLNNCGNCHTINTQSFPSTPTDSAARTAIRKMDSTVQNGYSDAVRMFNELLMYPLPNETDGDAYVKRTSSRKMHEALGEGIRRSQIAYSSTIVSAEAADVIAVEASEKDKGDSTGDYHRKYFAAMREAEAYRASGKRDVALQKFNDILTWVLPTERPWTEYWQCITSYELLALTGQIAKEQFREQVAACIPMNAVPSGLRMSDSNEEPEPIVVSDDLNAKVFPNPANDVLSIEVEQSPEAISVFELYSATGQLITTKTIAGNGQRQIDVAKFPAGLYFYRIKGESDRIKEGKLVISE